MASILLVTFFVAVVLYRIVRYMFVRPDNFPPGPPKIPIVGSYLFILPFNYNHMHRATEFLARWYKTSILGFHYASVPSVCVHDLATTKEVLNNPDLDGRPVFSMVRARDPNFNVWGIFFLDGPFWKTQRRFTLRHLRDFGFGRRFDELEIHIDEELRSWVDLIKNGPKFEHEKQLVDGDGVALCPFIFSAHPANLFLKCVLNERLPRHELGTLFKAGSAGFEFQRNGCMYGRIFSMIESLKYIFPNASGYNKVRNSSMRLHYAIRKIVTDQHATFDPSHERHFLDKYFKEMADEKDFNIDQLTHTVVDFIFPALTAVATTMSFVLQRLILNPKCMEKCQREIDEVVGQGRLPALDDRINLSYVEATLRESMRLDTLVANNVPHQALRDTKIGGYDLPKGGLVITVLQSAHTDEKHFKEALKFRPERFLSVNGRLNLKLDPSLPFGAGKRLCAGETFARNILFLFLATILQNFNVSVPPGHTMPDPALELQRSGTIKTPPDFYLKFASR